MLTLIKLKREGALNIGDTVHTERLGNCTVISIPELHTIQVKSLQGKYYTISGLNFGDACRYAK